MQNALTRFLILLQHVLPRRGKAIQDFGVDIHFGGVGNVGFEEVAFTGAEIDRFSFDNQPQFSLYDKRDLFLHVRVLRQLRASGEVNVNLVQILANRDGATADFVVHCDPRAGLG